MGDCKKLISQSEKKFDVIYLDPPWDEDYFEIIELAKKKLSSNGLIICEYDKKKPLEIEGILGDEFELYKEKKYGRANLAIIAPV